MSARFSGKSVIVTGGGGGMGRATSLAFAAEGANVLVADVADADGAETVAQVRAAGGTAEFLHVDVADALDVQEMVRVAVERGGGLDAAVNMAAIENEVAPLHDCEDDRFDRMIAVNLRSIFLCMKHEIVAMLAGGKGGTIVNVGSTNSFRPQPHQPAYTASKFGVLGITKQAAVDYAPLGIRINMIAPGPIDTPMLRGAMARRGRDINATQRNLSLLGRFGDAAEIARAVLWLSSDESSFTVGHALAVDGGYLAADAAGTAPTRRRSPRVYSSRAMDGAAATTFTPLVEAIFAGRPPMRITFWDGSSLGPDGAELGVRITSPDAVGRIVWAPGELGVARAFVAGDIEVDGNLAAALREVEGAVRGDPKRLAHAVTPALRALRETRGFTKPLPAPPEEIVPRGLRHSITRDRTAVSHHYDVGNDFYALVLGPSMTYSCARFTSADTSLEDAEAAKHELICRKLGLHEASGARLLDVGCGWGSMALHAAEHHGCRVVGITISEEQAKAARARVAQAGLSDRVEIRLQDYRHVDDGPYDAISSVGMAEHVGRRRMGDYFTILHRLLRPQGRVLNHAISSPGGSRIGSRSFIGRYVFPDGELLDVADTVRAMQDAGFEIRDAENLREHYAETLAYWVANLERHWDDAVGLVGERRARVRRLYMSGSIVRFDDVWIVVHQVLGVRPDTDGTSGMPRSRASWD